MRVFFCFVVFALATVVAIPAESGRIIGGFSTVIEQYPFSSTVLRHVSGNNFRIFCGGSVLNNRAVLTAAHCFDDRPATSNWRLRVGSTNAHSGGTVHNVNRIIVHPNYQRSTIDSDISIARTSSAIVFNNQVRPGSIAGPNYNLADNLSVWAIGWGSIAWGGNTVEQLRHVQVWTINQATCRMRYQEIGQGVTDNMMCTGVLDVGGRGQCRGDGGSPVLHGNVIVGITSWGWNCAQPRFPAVNVRVSRFTNWIQNNV